MSFLSFNERLQSSIRYGIPYAVLGALFMLNAIALPYPFTGAIKPPFFLIVLYYWCIYRPQLIPVWFVFVAGLLIDFLGALPLGMNALSFIIARWIIVDQRRFLLSQSFIVIWLGFALLTAGVYLLQWFVFGLAHAVWISPAPLFYSALTGVFLFPFISFVLHLSLKPLRVLSQDAEPAGFSVSRRKKRR